MMKMGMSDFEERWLRLAILIYKTSTAAVKDVLDKAISPNYGRATFELRLETALSHNRTELSNKSLKHLLEYEIEIVFPPPPATLPNTYSKYDIGIVAKLIKFFVGKNDWKKGTDNLPDISNLRSFDWLNASPFTLVELMRLYRNWVYHHTGDTPINELEYNERFDDLVNILKNLNHDVGEVVDLRTGPLGRAKEDVVKTVKDIIEAAQVALKTDFAGLRTDVASSWQEIKCSMSKLEGLLNAFKDGMLTEDSLTRLWKKFEQYQAEAHKDLFRKIEEVLGMLGDLSSIVNELKADVAKKNDLKVLAGGINELLRKSNDAKLVLEKLESYLFVMPDLVQAVQKLIKTMKMKDSQNADEESGFAYEDKLRRAREACRMKNETMIHVREKDVYGDDVEGRSKADMLLPLLTATCRDIDDVRLKSDESKAFLNRDFSSIEKVNLDSIFKDDHVVVVRGLPGAGKSTSCLYLLKEWNAGRLWDEKYDFVFYINSPMLRFSLRQEPFNLQRALDVSYPNVFKEISYKDLSECRYLVILDAIDECDVDKICSNGSPSYEAAIMDAITNEADYDRMIVGRPLACHDVREKLLCNANAQFVEVLGFATEQVEEYVQRFFRLDEEKADEVWRRIRDNHAILGMAHLPVFANIICEVMSEWVCSIETMTELYVWACAIYFQKHLKKHHPDVKVRTLRDAFQEKRFINGLINDSKLAYENLKTGRTIVQADDHLHSRTIYSTPFIVRREEHFCFSHQTHLEFFSAIYLFSSATNLDEIVEQDRFRDVLPFLFGLLGGAVRDSDSPSIIKDFVAPLMGSMLAASKHPLCGKLGKKLVHQNIDLFLKLCFEFRNFRLLNEYELIWKSDVRIKVQYHHQLEHLLFFMKAFRDGKGNVRMLSIKVADCSLSCREYEKLHECISHGFGLERLELINCKLNKEHMSVLSPVLCLIPTVLLVGIRTSSAVVWKNFVQCVDDAREKGKLRLERLELINCRLNREQMSILSPVLCLISTVLLGEVRASSAVVWKNFVQCVENAGEKGDLRLKRLELINCNLNGEEVSVLSPALCFISTVRLEWNRSKSAVGWKSFAKGVNDAREKGKFRLERLELINCNLLNEMSLLSSALCFISTVCLERIRMSSAEGWKSFVRSVEDASENGNLRLQRLELSKCNLLKEMSLLSPALCLIPTIRLERIRINSVLGWKSFDRSVEDASENGNLRLQRLELIKCNLNKKNVSVLSSTVCLISTVLIEGTRKSSSVVERTLSRV